MLVNTTHITCWYYPSNVNLRLMSNTSTSSLLHTSGFTGDSIPTLDQDMRTAPGSNSPFGMS